MSTAAQVEGKARYCADCGTFAPGRHVWADADCILVER